MKQLILWIGVLILLGLALSADFIEGAVVARPYAGVAIMLLFIALAGEFK